MWQVWRSILLARDDRMPATIRARERDRKVVL